MSHSKAEKHKNLEELKTEYQHKLEVINEIKREKELREQQRLKAIEKEKKKRDVNNKQQAQEYKVEKDIDRREKESQAKESARIAKEQQMEVMK